MSGLDVDVMRARYDQLGRELDQLERERDQAIYERDKAQDALARVRAYLAEIEKEREGGKKWMRIVNGPEAVGTQLGRVSALGSVVIGLREALDGKEP